MNNHITPSQAHLLSAAIDRKFRDIPGISQDFINSKHYKKCLDLFADPDSVSLLLDSNKNRALTAYEIFLDRLANTDPDGYAEIKASSITRTMYAQYIGKLFKTFFEQFGLTKKDENKDGHSGSYFTEPKNI